MKTNILADFKICISVPFIFNFHLVVPLNKKYTKKERKKERKKKRKEGRREKNEANK